MASPPPNKVYYLTIDENRVGQRLDNFLMASLKGVPKTHLYRIIRKGEVRVNKKRAEPSYHLILGDRVRIPPIKTSVPKTVPKPSDKLLSQLEKAIIYEDKFTLCLNKPVGLPVHGGSGVSLGLIEALRVLRPLEKALSLAHRLDRDTSGVIVVAKKAGVLKELHQLFREGAVKKHYIALQQGRLPKGHLKVEAPLKKFELEGGERLVKVNPQGKPALSYFRPLKYFKEATLVDVEIMTGRTHQIRVHAQSIHHSIAGDEKYGDKEFNKAMRTKGLRRLFLHAARLTFKLSFYDEIKTFSAPLPQELEEVLTHLSPP